MDIDEEQYLAHYGILRKSGRYPWGSGKDKEERSRTFLSTVEEMRNKHGMTEKQIAESFGMNTSELRSLKAIANNAKKQADIGMAQRLKDKGYSNVAIGDRMGVPESTIRSWLKPGEEDKTKVIDSTAEMLKAQIEDKKYIDVGTGVERHLGVSRKKLDDAIFALKNEGYKMHYLSVEQLGTGKNTSLKVLTAPDVTSKEVYANRADIKIPLSFTEDGGRSYDKILPPLSVDSKRIAVRYTEEGGSEADGVIYYRPGTKDLSLGAARYAQVRIAVDGTHYLKGMAMPKDDLPAGVDLMFNTNKSSTGNKLDAMKPLKDDPESPFGAIVRQIQEPDENGKKRVTSAMNIIYAEGDWEKWSKSISSQMLSKQSVPLAKTQLDLTYKRKKAEFDEIMSLTDPEVKRKLLQSYADDADSSAVHLKAAALPRQGSHVILPISSMKETEVYAPNFNDGEKVVLIRYPHGGVFEIPELTVNNRHPEAKRLIGGAKDAIGIHSKVAERLSGADFDGDTVLVIPNNSRKIKTAPPLEGLKGFDPQRAYPKYDGMKVMTAREKGIEMGMISNLITDMTIKGATNPELARAVRHSMVVIDAEKHKLNYKQSAIDNGIAQLKEKYQGGKNAGAKTLISRASADYRVPERKARSASNGGPIDPVTGEKRYEETGATYLNQKTGKIEERKTKTTKLAEVSDAHKLSSGQPIEAVYADHANRLKDLANQARKETLKIKPTPYSPDANKKYADQVKSLDAKLNLALRNSPLERQAQIIANANFALKKAANPDLDKDDLKKLKSRELINARLRVGAKKHPIEITPEEWTAIQAGAISTHKLRDILNNSDLDKVKQLATPKTRSLMTPDNKNRAVLMIRNGYTQAEVAGALGVSVSTLKKSLSEGDA